MKKENPFELYLLYEQLIEIQHLYYQKIKYKTITPKKYYLFPKKWFDKYKNKFNYPLIKEEIKLEDCFNINSFKQKIGNRQKDNNFNNELEYVSSIFEQEKQYIPNYRINFPNNFVIFKQEIFENLNSNLLYDVIIDEKTIIIFDNKNEKNIYFCSINYNSLPDDISDYILSVDSFMILDQKKQKKEKAKILNYISENGGIQNYFKFRNIDINQKGEQKVFNKEEEEIGIFYNRNNDNKKSTPEIFDKIDSIQIVDDNNQIIKKKEPTSITNIINKTNITEIGLIQYFGQNKVINHQEKDKNNIAKINNPSSNPKCITIYGDIYYYLNKNEKKNNCTIYEEYI